MYKTAKFFSNRGLAGTQATKDYRSKRYEEEPEKKPGNYRCVNWHVMDQDPGKCPKCNKKLIKQK